jgi:hypothetical protein
MEVYICNMSSFDQGSLLFAPFSCHRWWTAHPPPAPSAGPYPLKKLGQTLRCPPSGEQDHQLLVDPATPLLYLLVHQPQPALTDVLGPAPNLQQTCPWLICPLPWRC